MERNWEALPACHIYVISNKKLIFGPKSNDDDDDNNPIHTDSDFLLFSIIYFSFVCFSNEASNISAFWFHTQQDTNPKALEISHIKKKWIVFTNSI